MKTKKTEDQERREQLREEIEVSRLWPLLKDLIESWVVSIYQGLRTCEGIECARLQGKLELADQILQLQKTLKADDVMKKIAASTTSEEGE